MRLVTRSKGAPRKGAPFAFALLFLAAPLCVAAVAADCPADHAGERVQVIHVYDGDTVKLTDGRRLRLIGINTPEVGYDDRSPEAQAERAKSFLQDLIHSHNRTLNLQYGQQHRDHYGRSLAHAFLEDGSNVAVRLLDQGLATTLVVPPNTWGQACYQRHEDAARAAGRGLWSLPAYQSLQGTSLPPETRGFRIVRGRVTEVRQARHSVWLDLDGPLVVRIPRKELANFTAGFSDAINGKTVEVRGWIKPDKQGLRLNLRHPAALLVIDNGND